MTLEERKPTGLLHSADELKQLIVENPDLPILVFAGDDANNGDYSYMSCSYVSAKKGEFLDCRQQIDECKCYTDRDDFEDDVENVLAEEKQYRDLSDDEFNTLVEQTVNEYDDFWKPCILLHVDGQGGRTMCTGMTSYNQPDGWISVRDRLPDTRRDIIICLETGEVCCGWYSPVLRVWCDMNTPTIKSVTHWRELPDPPRTEGEI